jgi:hypothetical protein
MKRLFTILLAAFFAANLSAQIVDTVLFENFQAEVIPEFPIFPFGDDTTWINVDEDGLNPFDNNEDRRRWYDSAFFHFAEDSITGETNYCAASLSYMEGFAPGNRNWLITPPIQVTDENYTFHWKSAPFQLPRYMDGYLVLVSTTSNDLYAGVFTDTIFQAASMESSVGDGQSIAVEDFVFTRGYIHADSLRDQDYVVLWEPGDSTLMRGLLEPHSVSLAAYAGQQVYIAFLHNADDDYFLAIDDVLAVRTQTSSVNDLIIKDLRFVTYPNPASEWLNVMYRLPAAASVSLRVADMGGRTVSEAFVNTTLPAGEQQHNLSVRNLAPGAYSLVLQVDGQSLTKLFVKK